MKTREICVPMSALAGEDGTGGKEGSDVSITVTGKVSRTKGGMAYVMPETVNGQPIGGEEKGEPDADEGPSREDLIKELQASGFR